MRTRFVRPLLLLFLLSACGKPDSPPPAPGASTAPAPKAMFVASAKSKVYHRPTCRYAQRVSPSNLITFSSREEAEKEGYRPCKTCKP